MESRPRERRRMPILAVGRENQLTPSDSRLFKEALSRRSIDRRNLRSHSRLRKHSLKWMMVVHLSNKHSDFEKWQIGKEKESISNISKSRVSSTTAKN